MVGHSNNIDLPSLGMQRKTSGQPTEMVWGPNTSKGRNLSKTFLSAPWPTVYKEETDRTVSRKMRW